MEASSGDPVMNKYIALGLNREAVPLAVANYGDNPTKVFFVMLLDSCILILCMLFSLGCSNQLFLSYAFGLLLRGTMSFVN